MTREEREIGRRWFEEVWNRGRREAIAELLAPEAVLHEADAEVIGPEGFYPFFDRMQATLSDVRVTVHETIQEDDRLCVRWTCTARHTGGGLGMPPTGKAVRVTGITIHRVAGGRIVEAWQNWDMLGLLEQLRAGETAPAPTYVAAR